MKDETVKNSTGWFKIVKSGASLPFDGIHKKPPFTAVHF